MKSFIKAGVEETEREASVLAPLAMGYLVMAACAAAALAVSARKVPYYGLDLKITRTLQAVRAGWFDRLMRFVCGLGYPVQADILGALVIGYLYRAGYAWEAITTVVATLGSLVVAAALILFANRPRPAPDLVRVNHKMWTTSFPSGHTLIFTAVGGFLGYLVWNSRLPRLVQIPFLTIFGGVVFLMGPARIYSGEHWASDVVAGYLAGSAWLALLIKFYQRGKPRYAARHPEAKSEKWLN